MNLLYKYQSQSAYWNKWSLLLGFLFISLNCGSSKNKPDELSKESHSAKKALLVVKEVEPDKGDYNYLTIAVKPQESAQDINRYFVSAQVLQGQGILLAAKEKHKNSFCYEIGLQENLCIGQLLPIGGNPGAFKEGKQFKFKCKYEPSADTKGGEVHSILVKVHRQDAYGKLLQEEAVNIKITIKKPSKPLVVVKELASSKTAGHYLSIAINPSGSDQDIHQYFVSAQVLEGQGILLAAREKRVNSFLYAVSLQEEQCLGTLLPTKVGQEAIFKQGGQLQLKCKYEPALGAKLGDKHKLLIKVSKQDSKTGVIREEQVSTDISIHQDYPADIHELPGIPSPHSLRHPTGLEVDKNAHSSQTDAQLNRSEVKESIKIEKPNIGVDAIDIKREIPRLIDKVEQAASQTQAHQTPVMEQMPTCITTIKSEQASTEDVQAPISVQPTQLDQDALRRLNPLKMGKNERRLVAKQEKNEDSSPNHFVLIKIKPQKNESIDQYFISAQLLEGRGTLLGASGKVNKKFQYKLSLDQEICLANLQPTQNENDSKFKQGNQLEFKCIYMPGVETKPGEQHRCLITAKCQDSEGKLVWQAQEEVIIIIKNPVIKKDRQQAA